jgi:hypothetical protein
MRRRCFSARGVRDVADLYGRARLVGRHASADRGLLGGLLGRLRGDLVSTWVSGFHLVRVSRVGQGYGARLACSFRSPPQFSQRVVRQTGVVSIIVGLLQCVGTLALLVARGRRRAAHLPACR